MSKQYSFKLIQQLKQYKQQVISIIDFFYIFSSLNKKKQFSLQYINKFIQSNYSHAQIEWKQISDELLLQMYEELSKFLEENQQMWKKEQKSASQTITQLIDEKKRITKILKQKNTTKQQLIDNYIEQIRRNKAILAKYNTDNNAPVKTSQKKVQKNAKQIKQNLQKQRQIQKFQLNIKTLEKRIDLMRKTDNFNNDNDEQIIKPESKIKYLKREEQLKSIAKQFEFKKKYFQDHQKGLLLSQLFQLNQKLMQMKKIFSKRLNQLFLHYSFQNFDSTLSFQKNSQKLVRMDLRLFLKYFKQLKEANQDHFFGKETEKQKLFKGTNLNNIFKKYSKNHKQISFEQFKRINFQLFLNEDFQFKEIDILKQQTDKLLQNKQEYKKKIQQTLELFKVVKQKFYNENINKILNIYSKTFSQESQRKKLLAEASQSTEPHRNKQNFMGKLIDKSLADYQLTRKEIHENFLKRNNAKRYRQSEELNGFSQEGVKIIISGKNGRTIQNLKAKKQFGHSLDKKKRNQNDFRAQRSLSLKRVATPLNKRIFEEIILEAGNQSQDDDEIEIRHIKGRTKSTGELLKHNHRQERLTPNLRLGGQTHSQLKQLFTLPKITRLSQQRFEHQSIVKTLDYLYGVLGKQQQSKIKKILDIDNPQLQRAYKFENQYLKSYFQKEIRQMNESRKNEMNMSQKKLQSLMKKCHKFKEENYQKFMKFS